MSDSRFLKIKTPKNIYAVYDKVASLLYFKNVELLHGQLQDTPVYYDYSKIMHNDDMVVDKESRPNCWLIDTLEKCYYARQIHDCRTKTSLKYYIKERNYLIEPRQFDLFLTVLMIKLNELGLSNFTLKLEEYKGRATLIFTSDTDNAMFSLYFSHLFIRGYYQ